MAYYINAVSSLETIRRDVKTLIPDPQLRRRMSYIVKAGVSTAMDCLQDMPEGTKISAIIVATGLGCLSDSEKFLRAVVANGEQLLTPTPFIQSTFNTVGAQVALLTGNNCYNMTYTNGEAAFRDALLDAVMKIEEGGGDVLLGAVDEATPTLEKVMGRMGLLKRVKLGEGFHFFVISARPAEGCLAVIKDIDFAGLSGRVTDPDSTHQPEVLRYESSKAGVYCTSDARLLFDAVGKVADGRKEIIIELSSNNNIKTRLTLGCI